MNEKEDLVLRIVQREEAAEVRLVPDVESPHGFENGNRRRKLYVPIRIPPQIGDKTAEPFYEMGPKTYKNSSQYDDE
jgi:hypothetical protein